MSLLRGFKQRDTESISDAKVMKESELLLLALLAAVSGCTAGQGNQSLNEVPLRDVTAADASAVPAMTNEWLTLKTLGVRLYSQPSGKRFRKPLIFSSKSGRATRSMALK